MEIPEFAAIMHEVTELKNLISSREAEKDFAEKFPAQWYNDQQCWALKGGMSLSTYRSNRYFQCKGGIPDEKVGGRKVWSRESVMEWVKIPDSGLDAYHAKYKTGAKKR